MKGAMRRGSISRKGGGVRGAVMKGRRFGDKRERSAQGVGAAMKGRQ